jgi:hypothetical protein
MNVVSVSWADHLVFGDEDGRLDTPDKSLASRYRHPSLTASRSLVWDDFAQAPALAHEAGLEAWLYVTVFDDGWPLASARERGRMSVAGTASTS